MAIDGIPTRIGRLQSKLAGLAKEATILRDEVSALGANDENLELYQMAMDLYMATRVAYLAVYKGEAKDLDVG